MASDNQTVKPFPMETYDLTIRIAVVGEPETYLNMVLEQSSREKLLTNPLTAGLVRAFEEFYSEEFYSKEEK